MEMAKRKRMAFAIAAGHSPQVALDAQFKEGEHHRDPDGKFGSNSGTPQNAYSAEGTRQLNEAQASKIPFVAAVFKDHQTNNKIRAHLTTVPTGKLKTAERMLNEHADKSDGQANSLKIWISRELDARADHDFDPSTGGKR